MAPAHQVWANWLPRRCRITWGEGLAIAEFPALLTLFCLNVLALLVMDLVPDHGGLHV